MLVVFNYGEFMRKLDIVYAESGLCDFKRGTLCSLPRQVDSEVGEFSACCLKSLGGNFPSAPWGRSSL